jgi:hypothetical protein
MDPVASFVVLTVIRLVLPAALLLALGTWLERRTAARS